MGAIQGRSKNIRPPLNLLAKGRQKLKAMWAFGIKVPLSKEGRLEGSDLLLHKNVSLI
jgi:hypothetical protein